MVEKANAQMIRVVLQYGEMAHGNDPYNAALGWSNHGFSPEDASGWLAAGVFTPEAARALDGWVTPAQAAMKMKGHTETIGYMVANGDVTPEGAANWIGMEAG